jgi:cytoskeletal protein CcmA (bactofilin family)
MTTLDETRAVVERGQTYEDPIIPTRKAEIARPVRVDTDGTVTDGVYGETVSVDTGATIGGPVMAKDAVQVDGGVVEGDIGTPGKVETESATIHGTVTATRVRLVDTTVIGNVVAQEAILEDCTVIGTVVGERSLTIESTTCYTFKSYTDGTITDTEILLPQAVLDGAFTLQSSVVVRSIQRKDEFVSEQEQEFPTLTHDDVYSIDGTRYITLVPRLLDMDHVEERIDQLEAFLRATVLARHNGEAFECPPDSEWVLDTFETDADALDFSDPS